MGIHLPLSLKSQAEAKILMLSNNNLLTPSSSSININPSQDIVIGTYFLTNENLKLFYLFNKIF